mgnify:CR=1 FL=1
MATNGHLQPHLALNTALRDRHFRSAICRLVAETWTNAECQVDLPPES